MLAMLPGLLLEPPPHTPGCYLGPPSPLLFPSLASLATSSLTYLVAGLAEGQVEGARAWLRALPVATREEVLGGMVEEGERSGRSREEMLRLLSLGWRVLYTGEWRRVEVPHMESSPRCHAIPCRHTVPTCHTMP